VNHVTAEEIKAERRDESRQRGIDRSPQRLIQASVIKVGCIFFTGIAEAASTFTLAVVLLLLARKLLSDAGRATASS
jgi:hypothetical protein